MQEKRVDGYGNVDSHRSLSDSCEGFTKFTLLQEKASQGMCVVRREIDKKSNDYQTRSCVARSMDENLVKPLSIEKNKNGKTRGQNSTMLDD